MNLSEEAKAYLQNTPEAREIVELIGLEKNILIGSEGKIGLVEAGDTSKNPFKKIYNGPEAESMRKVAMQMRDLEILDWVPSYFSPEKFGVAGEFPSTKENKRISYGKFTPQPETRSQLLELVANYATRLPSFQF